MQTTKYLTSGNGIHYLQLPAAKRRNHLSNENLETLFLLVALKLPAKNLYEFEQEIKLDEGELKSTIFQTQT